MGKHQTAIDSRQTIVHCLKEGKKTKKQTKSSKKKENFVWFSWKIINWQGHYYILPLRPIHRTTKLETGTLHNNLKKRKKNK
jgi:hypothetical protein